MDLPLGKIDVDSPFGREICFTSDGFHDYSYCWGMEDGVIVLSMMASKHKGAFRAMMQAIEKKGLTFKIPTPSPRMMQIGKKQGWRMDKTKDPLMGTVFYLTNAPKGKKEKRA